jgi:prolyl-tRNA editing enzyme YbaK/EbsC (Cys-tRNA(Pro) deacylase)
VAASAEARLATRLGLDPNQIIKDSLSVEFVGNHACVTWEGTLLLPLAELADLIGEAAVTEYTEVS